ncbi:hypothetical protein GLV94_13490 [Virgibacillus halodenitrificans]|jgi:hypothetical protein|nr:hypothetical protein [Virgibacillus halodenitrificans]MYL56132.1 hypothetical protein [Virgibacillus halodenitrificans]
MLLFLWKEGGAKMEEKMRDLENQLIDYKRFVSALLILSSYLYMGGIIKTYLQPTSHGGILFLLSLISVSAGIWFIGKGKGIQDKISQER